MCARHAELASDFGKPVRADQDNGDHGDDEKFCRVEIEHCPALFVVQALNVRSGLTVSKFASLTEN